VRERKRKRVSRDLEQIGRKSEDCNLGANFIQTANSLVDFGSWVHCADMKKLKTTQQLDLLL
jgi:hypothetical protein